MKASFFQRNIYILSTTLKITCSWSRRWLRRINMIVWNDVGCVESLLSSIYISIVQLLFFQSRWYRHPLTVQKRSLNVAIMSIVLAQHLLVRFVVIFITRPLKQFSNLAMCTAKIALEREEKENLSRAKADSLTWSLGSVSEYGVPLTVIRHTKKVWVCGLILPV